MTPAKAPIIPEKSWRACGNCTWYMPFLTEKMRGMGVCKLNYCERATKYWRRCNSHRTDEEYSDSPSAG